jgi:chitodextrinase
MKTKICFLFFALLVVLACEKRKYPPEQTYNHEEVFKIKAQVDNQPVDLRAGADSYYCYSACSQGNDGVFRLTGELKKYGCNPCPESFYLQINDLMPRAAGAAIPVDSILKAGVIGIVPPTSHVNSFRFSPIFNKPAASFQWDFGDGATSSENSPVHQYGNPGKYRVCLKARSVSNCENTACYDLLVLEEGGIVFAGITAQPISDLKARFTAQVTGKAPFNYTWHFGDGTTNDIEIAEHEYKWPGGYPVKLIVKDAAGHVTEASYNYVTYGDPSSCAANFSVQHEGLTINALSKAKISWTDKTNRVFSSDKIAQPSESFFEILNASEFQRTESGTPTKLLRTRINVLLSDGSRSFWLKSDEAIVAVGYK